MPGCQNCDAAMRSGVRVGRKEVIAGVLRRLGVHSTPEGQEAALRKYFDTLDAAPPDQRSHHNE